MVASPSEENWVGDDSDEKTTRMKELEQTQAPEEKPKEEKEQEQKMPLEE